MPNYNKVILMGHLTRDPELKYTPNGKPVVTFGLAVNNSWKDEKGNKSTGAIFVDLIAFGSIANTVNQNFKKGNPIFIEGRLNQNTWEDKQTGQRRSKLSVLLESFQFVGAPKQNETKEIEF